MTLVRSTRRHISTELPTASEQRIAVILLAQRLEHHPSVTCHELAHEAHTPICEVLQIIERFHLQEYVRQSENTPCGTISYQLTTKGELFAREMLRAPIVRTAFQVFVENLTHLRNIL